MPPDPDRRLRPRMTLRQVGVLVVFVAVALAVLMPIGRSAVGLWGFALLGAFELPLALLLPTLLLVRRGPIKSGIITALLCLPFAAILAFVNQVGATGLWSSGLSMDEIPALVMLGIADCGFLALLATLGSDLVPRACPTCGRLAMLRDPSAPRSRDFPAPSVAMSCLACGSRFRRSRRDPWVDVDAPIPPPSGRPASASVPATEHQPR